MAYPSTTISTQPFRAKYGSPMMTPKQYMNVPRPTLGVQDVSKAAMMGMSVQPSYVPRGDSGIISQPTDFLYVPQKQIDLGLQKYFSAKDRLLRQIEFTRNLLRSSYATTKYANKLNNGRELFQRAMQIRNEVAGLSAPLAMNLARNERESRAVGSAVQSGMERNDINAAVRSGVPQHQGIDVTDDDEYLPSGGIDAGKGQAMAEQEGLDAPVAERMRDRMEHFEAQSTSPEVGGSAGALKKELEDVMASASSGAELDRKLEQGGVDDVADEYAREGKASGADPKLTKADEKQALYAKLTEELDNFSGGSLVDVQKNYNRIRNQIIRNFEERPPTYNEALALRGGRDPPPKGVGRPPRRAGTADPMGVSTGATTQSILSMYGGGVPFEIEEPQI